MKKSEIIILGRISCRIDVDTGIHTKIWKYRVRFTGKTYVGLSNNELDDSIDYDFEKGFRGPLRERVKPENLLKLEIGLLSYHPDEIYASTYFLESDLEKAKEEIRTYFDKEVDKRKKYADELFKHWTTRKSLNKNKE